MTTTALENALAELAVGGQLTPAGRAALEAAVVAELATRGHFDWNGIRYTARAGRVVAGLPWG
jgi:hypothetical protein